jgi:hypothetical protein
MRVDFKIPAHLNKKITAYLFFSILEGGEFFAQIQAAMASFSLAAHEFAGDLPPPGEPSEPALEFRTLHYVMIGHFCPSVKGGILYGRWLSTQQSGTLEARGKR